ncbi:DUF2480 family protein [Abyssalbus ytuae]|uniref:DUF2480 family protein n=1 Tax=Abyssalbus ytuae TaxID=2926907 RepID=A0A9E7D1R8_9FLAO|nr:DUF2480 family protein [Abyssalbus ytuae]UOB15924.1 DUF2480 family protein [Abyssalbus ytuae]
MAGEIINRVAQSKLVTFNLEDFYPEGKRILFDISDWLLEGLILKENDFRENVKQNDWQQYKDTYVALTCSTDAIIPAWAYMLITTHLTPFTKKVIVGNLNDLEISIYNEIIDKLDLSALKDLPVIVKGCSSKPVPQNAYISLVQKLQPIAKSIMYGEACSSVPLFKRK